MKLFDEQIVSEEGNLPTCVPQFGMTIPFGKFKELNVISIVSNIQDAEDREDVVISWIDLEGKRDRRYA